MPLSQSRALAALIALCLGLVALPARALDIVPYSEDVLAQAQAAGRPVAVHFHADWCPTCRTQEKALQSLQDDPQLKGVTVLVADYDKEKALKRALNVRAQSTLVVFRGRQEVARNGGAVEPAALKAVLVKAL